MSAVGTSMKFAPSALTYNRVRAPPTSRRSWRIEKPLRSTATSPAKQGRAAMASVTKTARRSRNEIRERISNYSNEVGVLIADDQRFRTQRQIYCGGDAAGVIAAGYSPTPAAQLRAGIPHDNRMAGKLKHFYIVVVVTDGHDLLPAVTTMDGPALQSMALGAACIQHVDHRQIPRGILGSQYRDRAIHSCAFQCAQRVAHPLHRPTEHRLHRIALQRLLDWDDELDVLDILLEPSANTGAELVEPFEDDCALGLFVKRSN